MNRREVIAVLAFATCVDPALAQPAERQYRLAILSPSGSNYPLLMQELAKRGFTEGADLIVDFRAGTPSELARLAGEIVSAKPDAIVAVSTALGALEPRPCQPFQNLLAFDDFKVVLFV
jgi:putative ABC transport system substrate-binding protein